MDYRYDIRKNNLCPTLTTRGRSSVSGVPIIYDNKNEYESIGKEYALYCRGKGIPYNHNYNDFVEE